MTNTPQLQAMAIRFLERCMDAKMPADALPIALRAFIEEMKAPAPEIREPARAKYERAPRTHAYGPAVDPGTYWSPEKARAYRWSAQFQRWQTEEREIFNAEWEMSDRLPVNEWLKVSARIFRRDNWTCTYCGAHGDKYKLHCDHIVPLALGGWNDDQNLTTACEYCNCSKRDKWLWIWSCPLEAQLLLEGEAEEDEELEPA